jgi:outer membrane protein assembly factor BamB
MFGLRIVVAVVVIGAGWAVGIDAAGATTGPSQWPQIGANAAHTGSNPNEAILSASTAAHLSLKWVYNTSVGDPPSIPVVADGKVFVSAFDGSLEAIDPTTGVTVWKDDTLGGSPSHPFTAPVIAGGTLYSYQVNSGLLYTISDATGVVERTTPMLNNEGLVYSDGVLYTQPVDTHGPTPPMGAYDAATGAQLWTADVSSLLSVPGPTAKFSLTATTGSSCCQPQLDKSCGPPRGLASRTRHRSSPEVG